MDEVWQGLQGRTDDHQIEIQAVSGMEGLAACHRGGEDIRAWGFLKLESISVPRGWDRFKQGDIEAALAEETWPAVGPFGGAYQAAQGIAKCPPEYGPFIGGQNHQAGYPQGKAEPGK